MEYQRYYDNRTRRSDMPSNNDMPPITPYPPVAVNGSMTNSNEMPPLPTTFGPNAIATKDMLHTTMPNTRTNMSRQEPILSNMRADAENKVFLDMKDTPSLAFATVPMQKFMGTYPCQEALRKGTIFPELDMPYKKGGRR